MKISELPLAPSVSSTDDVPIDRSGVTYRVHYEELRGNGIASIAKTGTSGLVDTYTITFTDGSTFSYTVTNGASGSGAWGTITGTLSDQTDLQNALNAKANAADVYTKSQVDTALSGKADASDTYTKAQADSLFTNTVVSGEWTATTMTGSDAVLTDKIAIGAGTWLVIVKLPVCGGSASLVGLASESTVTMLPSANYCATANYNMILAIVTNTTVGNKLYAVQSSSAVATFSFLERGGIFAIKLY